MRFAINSQIIYPPETVNGGDAKGVPLDEQRTEICVAPTIFQNSAANLTRSLRCSVELLTKYASSMISLPR
jgi:hypothetical protein